MYRKLHGGNIDLERTTVHVSDGQGRIAMLEVRTVGDAGHDNDTEQTLKRFIYSNHLGSSALELTGDGEVISYEEYHPYGTTAYQGQDGHKGAVAKRYRFTGKERDEESGLSYHGARYYAPWLARWCAVDPLESKYAPWSPYAYVHDNPVNGTDSSGMGDDPPKSKMPNMIIDGVEYASFRDHTINVHNKDGSNQTMTSGEWAPVSEHRAFEGTDIRNISYPAKATVNDGNLQHIATSPTINDSFVPAQQPAASNGADVAARVWGGIKGVGGTLEMVAGAVGGAATSWTGIGAVAGGAAVLHGADVAAAGFSQMLTGAETTSFTEQGISAGLQTAGVNPQKANTIAGYSDVVLSAALSMGASLPTSSTSNVGKALSDIPWITKGSLPIEEETALTNTIDHINAGTKPTGMLGKKWATTFKNYAGDLPGTPGAGGYLEYKVSPPPGVSGPGVRRLVTSVDGQQGFYTWTHYGDQGAPSFVRIW